MPSNRRSLLAAAGQGEALYVEDVFSTYLYKGNGSTQTITNGIDLDGKGGMVWVKNRDATDSHVLTDTVRGAGEILSSDATTAETTDADTITFFNSTGFSLGADVKVNTNTEDYVSWTFRKAPKFFDVVTYTGTGSATTIAHSLGATVGCIIIKNLDVADAWAVYHRSNTANPETDYLVLNTTAATVDDATYWNDTAPTDAVFTVGTNHSVNASGENYVAYLFAHDAGGFGADGSESIIKCGSYTGTGAAGNEIDLGWEPQLIIHKQTSGGGGSWNIQDNARGFAVKDNNPYLRAESSNAETSTANFFSPTAEGFVSRSSSGNSTSENYIYIAIRRPMKVPESGTEVFAPLARTGTGAEVSITSAGFPPDLFLSKRRTSTQQTLAWDRLRGASNVLIPPSGAAESSAGSTVRFLSFDMDGYTLGTDSGYDQINASGQTQIDWVFKRAPEFMDVVCWTGTSANQTVTHGLSAAPELWIVKSRTGNRQWIAGTTLIPATSWLYFSSTSGQLNSYPTYWNSTYPTSSVFSLGSSLDTNASGEPYVAYLFATLAGVSKVGSYTGTAASLDLDMGFTTGARFFLCKRTDSTGDWYVYDTARGIVAGNDPYLLLNSTAAEVTGTDYVDPLASGLTLTAAGSSTINISGADYIYLAIA
jgi:hypothetical protein